MFNRSLLLGLLGRSLLLCLLFSLLLRLVLLLCGLLRLLLGCLLLLLLLLDLLSSLLRLILLLLDLRCRGLVVIVIAATDEGQPGGADTSAGARANQRSPR